jgi:hypothetical protein
MTVGIRCAGHATPSIYKKFALTSPTSGSRLVGIVRSRTKATEFSFLDGSASLQSTELMLVGRLNCCWLSLAQSFLASGLIETFDQDFFLLACTCLRNGTVSLTRGGVCLSVKALHLMLPCCYSVQVHMGTVHPLSLLF